MIIHIDFSTILRLNVSIDLFSCTKGLRRWALAKRSEELGGKHLDIERVESFLMLDSPDLSLSLDQPRILTQQGPRKVWKSGGASSNVIGIICQPGWDRVNWSANIWDCHETPATPSTTGSDSPAAQLNPHSAHQTKVHQLTKFSDIWSEKVCENQGNY